MGAKDVLETVFVHDLDLPPDVVAFLLGLWDLIQGLDDWMDDTPTPKDARTHVVWLALVGLPSAPFWRRHLDELLPVLANCVLRWQAANIIEDGRESEHLPKAYMWRAGYYDMVLQTVLIVHGPEAALRLAPAVMRIYGERLEDYLKEFSCV